MVIRPKQDVLAGIVRYQKGDSAAFDTVYYGSVQYVTKCVQNVLNRTAPGASEELVMDIVQDTYMTVAEKLDTLSSPEAFYQWAGRIATHHAQRTWNRENRRYQMEMPEEELLYEPIDEAFIPEQLLYNRELQQQVRQMLQQLPDHQYLCIVEYFYNGLKEAEVAQKLQMPLNTVKTNLLRAKKKLKTMLQTEQAGGVKFCGMGVLLLVLLMQEVAFVKPVWASRVLEAVRAAMDMPAAAGGASAAAMGTGTATGGTAAAGTGFLATVGGKVIAAVLAVSLAAGGVLAAVGVSRFISAQVQGGQQNEQTGTTAPMVENQEDRPAEAFWNKFRPADESVVVAQEPFAVYGVTCRWPQVVQEAPGRDVMNTAIEAAVAQTLLEYTLRSGTWLDNYRAQAINGLLYMEDVTGTTPNFAMDVLTGEVYTAWDIYAMYGARSEDGKAQLEEMLRANYQLHMDQQKPGYTQEGLEGTLDEGNLQKASFLMNKVDGEADWDYAITVPEVDADGNVLGVFRLEGRYPDKELVVTRQEGTLRGGRTAYRIPQVCMDSKDAAQINKEINELAGWAGFEDCYSLNYNTWVSGRFVVLQTWVEILASTSIKNYYIDMITGEEVTQDQLMDMIGMTKAELVEHIRPQVQAFCDGVKNEEMMPGYLKQQTLETKNLEKSTIVLKEDGSVRVRYTYYHIAGSGHSYGSAELRGGTEYEEGFLPEFLREGAYPQIEQLLENLRGSLMQREREMDYGAWVCGAYLLVAIRWQDCDDGSLEQKVWCCDMAAGELLTTEAMLADLELTQAHMDAALEEYFEGML